jgi:UDP-glucose 4-epimerase
VSQGDLRTLLVTGATGFLGTHLVRRLCRERSLQVVALGRGGAPDAPGTSFVRCALEDLEPATWREAGVGPFDVVFHLAAFTPKHAGENQLEEVHRSNLRGTSALLGSLARAPRRVVFASTLDVYALAGPDGVLDEGSPTRPADLYGASKLFGEQLVREYAAAEGCEHAILRYGHLFGPGEERYRKLIPTVIRGLLREEAPTLVGDGTALRDLLYVEDAVEATVRASSADTGLLDPLNVVRGESVSVEHVVKLLASLTGFAGEPKRLPGNAPIHSFRFDASRMRAALGTWEMVSLEEGLRREVAHFRRLAA